MQDILDEMEEHIAEIRNLQRHFDFHSKQLEKLMKVLEDHFRVSVSSDEDVPRLSTANE
jgi:hypothetical protein